MDSDAWNERYSGEELLWGSVANRLLVAEVGGMPAGRALDLGCGEGRNAVWLASQGWQATGIDFSAVALGKAARLAAERGVTVDWLEEDVRTWVPPAGTFDLVLVAFLHFPHPQRRLVHRSAADALVSGGTILIVGHDLANLSEGNGGPQDPAILLTVDDVSEDLVGLSIDQAEQIRFAVPTADGEAMAVDTVVRATRTT